MLPKVMMAGKGVCFLVLSRQNKQGKRTTSSEHFDTLNLSSYLVSTTALKPRTLFTWGMDFFFPRAMLDNFLTSVYFVCWSHRSWARSSKLASAGLSNCCPLAQTTAQVGDMGRIGVFESRATAALSVIGAGTVRLPVIFSMTARWRSKRRCLSSSALISFSSPFSSIIVFPPVDREFHDCEWGRGFINRSPSSWLFQIGGKSVSVMYVCLVWVSVWYSLLSINKLERLSDSSAWDSCGDIFHSLEEVIGWHPSLIGSCIIALRSHVSICSVSVGVPSIAQISVTMSFEDETLYGDVLFLWNIESSQYSASGLVTVSRKGYFPLPDGLRNFDSYLGNDILPTSSSASSQDACLYSNTSTKQSCDISCFSSRSMITSNLLLFSRSEVPFLFSFDRWGSSLLTLEAIWFGIANDGIFKSRKREPEIFAFAGSAQVSNSVHLSGHSIFLESKRHAFCNCRSVVGVRYCRSIKGDRGLELATGLPIS